MLEFIMKLRKENVLTDKQANFALEEITEQQTEEVGGGYSCGSSSASSGCGSN